VTRNRIRLRVDMLARGLAVDSLVVSGVGFTDTTENYTSFDDIGIEHPILFQIMRDGVLREQRCLQSNFCAHPFTL
jgi:hypothetical protein